MSVCELAHEIPGGAEPLDTIAQRLFGLPYTQLDDAQADAVWRAIEETEQDNAADSSQDSTAQAAGTAG